MKFASIEVGEIDWLKQG